MANGFCGCCSLHASTIVALIFTLIECVVGLVWNAQLLLLLDNKLPDLLSTYVNVEQLDDFDVVRGMTLASTGLNILWIVFILMAFKGNAALTHGLLTPYVILTYLITLFDIGSSIYFSIKFQEKYVRIEGFFDSSTGKGNAALTYATLISLFSRGCLLWFINIYFAHLTEKRGKEIDENYSALTFYILSQLSRALKENDPERGISDSPPAYCPSYLPEYILQATRDSRESSWSLNNDVLRGIDSNVNCPGYINPLYPLMSRGLTEECQGPPPVYRETEPQRLTNYILSQLSTSVREHSMEQGISNCPTSTYPPYMPAYIMEATRDSLESSWSLQDETFRGTCPKGIDSGFTNPLYPNLTRELSIEHQDHAPQNPCSDQQRVLS